MRAALEAWSKLQIDEQQLPHQQRGEQHPHSTPANSMLGLAGLVAQPRREPRHDPPPFCDAGSGSSSIRCRPPSETFQSVRTDGNRTGTLRLTRTVWSFALIDARRPAPRPREVLDRLVGVRAVLAGVRGVDRQLARALARRVAGEHERVADEPDLPQQNDHDQQQRQDARELGAASGRARRREPGEQAARLAVARRPGRRRRARTSSSATSASKAPRSFWSSMRAGEPVLTAASNAAKSAGIVVWASRPPTTLRARSGWTSRLREVRLSTTSMSVVVAHLQALPEVAQAPHAAQRDDVGRRDDEHLGWPSRRRSRSPPTQWRRGRRPSARGAPDRAEHVARDGGVDLLRPLAVVGREQQPEALLCVYSVSCRWRTEISSATSTRSTTLRR